MNKVILFIVGMLLVVVIVVYVSFFFVLIYINFLEDVRKDIYNIVVLSF